MTKTENNMNLSLTALIKTEIKIFLLNYLLATQLKKEACDLNYFNSKMLKRNFTNKFFVFSGFFKLKYAATNLSNVMKAIKYLMKQEKLPDKDTKEMTQNPIKKQEK